MSVDVVVPFPFLKEVVNEVDLPPFLLCTFNFSPLALRACSRVQVLLLQEVVTAGWRALAADFSLVVPMICGSEDIVLAASELAREKNAWRVVDMFGSKTPSPILVCNAPEGG